MPNTSYGSEIALFTSTLYTDDPISKVRQELALKLFQNAQSLGIQCVVVDGGSNQEFLTQARAYENVMLVTMEQGTMGEARREALHLALTLGTPNVMWIEPEKDTLVTAENMEKIIVPLRAHEADIVVPARTEASFRSLPPLQSKLEQRANDRASNIISKSSEVGDAEIDQAWDLWFGPKAMTREGAKYFEDYRGELDKWDAIIKPVHQAFRDGKKIKPVVVDYVYHEAQTASEEADRPMRRKRIEQYVEILRELGDPFWDRPPQLKNNENKMR